MPPPTMRLFAMAAIAAMSCVDVTAPEIGEITMMATRINKPPRTIFMDVRKFF